MLESRFDGVASWTIDMDARVGIEPSDVGIHAFGSDMRADDDVDDVADADA
jgi:hypothetical protein